MSPTKNFILASFKSIAFLLAAAIASGVMSRPVTLYPACAAPKEKRPEPQPRSSIVDPLGIAASNFF